MATSLADAVLFLQMILLLLPVIAALFQMVVRTYHRDDVKLKKSTAAIGMLALVVAAMMLSFAAWGVLGYIADLVSDERMTSAIESVRLAIILLTGFIYIFGVAVTPRFAKRAPWKWPKIAWNRVNQRRNNEDGLAEDEEEVSHD